MKRPRQRILLLISALTIAVLALSVPGALRFRSEYGGFYLFSTAFLEDLPKRLAGPGRLRFIFQPTMAILLGISYPVPALMVGPVLITVPYALSRAVTRLVAERMRPSPPSA